MFLRKTVISVIIGFLVVVNTHAYDPSEKEKIYGTWINPEYGKMWEGGERYEINRISNSGKTLELILSEYDFPEGIHADHPHYRIYFRREE